MRSARLLFGLVIVTAGVAGLLLLHACQDTPQPTELTPAVAAVLRTLTITASGSGSGVVTSSPQGINCTVTAGVVAATGCKAQFGDGVIVTLTAVPMAGHSFERWYGNCAGTGPCKLTMTADRTAEARFLKGPFTIGISSGTPGVGTGTVKTQVGLLPAINCNITNGTPATTGCSAKYPAYTALTLTATPAAGFGFTGWGSPCSGTGTCKYTVIRGRTIPASFAPAGSSVAATKGRWETVFSTPVVAIHVSLLATGKLLLWGDSGSTVLWDPANPGGGFTSVAKTYQFFCSGHTFLPDGRLLVTGGSIGAHHEGNAKAALFTPGSGGWSSTGSMAQGRYYPTLTTLPSGEVLALSGSDESGVTVGVPEIWSATRWRRLTTASLAIPNPYYPMVFVAPNGKVFLAGFPQTSRYLDVGSGTWTTVANRKVADRRAGSAVMYAPGKILYVGGGDPPTNSAEVIDLNQPSPAWRSVAGMAFARRQLNATLLADGQVLVTHGSSGAGFNNVAAAIHTAELWNPATESWSTMADEAKSRTYHSTALLLPDARVLSSGSGEGGGVLYANSELTGQVFSPPYLFNANGSLATRPTITSAPVRLSYGQPFTVQTPAPASISRGTLIRLSSVTHAFNMSQLIYPLTFTVTGATSLASVGPARASLAPPGPYMLFLLNTAGVPSVARMVTVGP